jgi:hypothetical protein
VAQAFSLPRRHSCRRWPRRHVTAASGCRDEWACAAGAQRRMKRPSVPRSRDAADTSVCATYSGDFRGSLDTADTSVRATSGGERETSGLTSRDRQGAVTERSRKASRAHALAFFMEFRGPKAHPNRLLIPQTQPVLMARFFRKFSGVWGLSSLSSKPLRLISIGAVGGSVPARRRMRVGKRETPRACGGDEAPRRRWGDWRSWDGRCGRPGLRGLITVRFRPPLD